MLPFRYSILAVAVAATMGAGITHAADRAKDDDDRPGVRRCTNDPNMANDLYEYLQDCPAAQGLLNSSGQWVAVEKGRGIGTPANPGGPAMGTPSNPGGPGMGTPSAPGGGAMSTPSAPKAGKAN
jgi:hypothetical protein